VTTYGFDTGVTWTGGITVPTYPVGYPYGQEVVRVWWFEKLYTKSTAKVDFDR